MGADFHNSRRVHEGRVEVTVYRKLCARVSVKSSLLNNWESKNHDLCAGRQDAENERRLLDC